MIIIKLVKITDKKEYHYKGKVYDLEVADIHSYNIDGLVVHNSGGGSVVNNLLGITKMDPIEYDLIFERFLNPTRKHLPDIDTDYCMLKGPQVFQHLIDKYGKEYVANVCTFMKMQMKQCIKDVGRVLGVPYDEVNNFTKNIPDRDLDGNPIDHIDNLEKLPGAQEFIKKYPEVIKYAKLLEGTVRQMSMHPSGVGVSPIPVTDLLPVTQAKVINADTEPGYLAQAEKENFENFGLVKIDVKFMRRLILLITGINKSVIYINS